MGIHVEFKFLREQWSGFVTVGGGRPPPQRPPPLSRQNPLTTTTETRFYEPTRLSTQPKPLFSLKLLDATTWLRSLLSDTASHDRNANLKQIWPPLRVGSWAQSS